VTQTDGVVTKLTGELLCGEKLMPAVVMATAPDR
jgi:hypothetical protein